MSNYVKEEIFLEEVPSLDLLKEEVTIEENHDTDVVIKEERENEGFPSCSELNIHHATHSELKPLKSESPYSTPYSEKHSDELSSGKCSKCECAFESKDDLINHINTMHSIETPFQCKVCSKRFPTSAPLKGHSKTHNEEQEPSVDERKVTAHYDKGRFICEVCGKKFSKARNLKEHMERHGKKRNHKCSECEYSSKTKPDLRQHIRIRHPTETPFPCKVCSKSFSTTNLLKIHSASHNEEKPYKCDQCPITCKLKLNLDRHKARVHNNAGKFTCEVCGKKFLYEAQFKQHAVRHSKEKNHKCSECEYASKTKYDLTLHIRLQHSTETPFQCEVCSKRFSILPLLKIHSLNHNGETPSVSKS